MSMTPGDTDGLGDRLRAERPVLDEDGEARVRETVAGRFAEPPRASRRVSIAVAALLAAGLTLTGGGAAIAISGLAADTTAVNAQYSTPVPPGAPPPAPPGTTAPVPPGTSTPVPPGATPPVPDSPSPGSTGTATPPVSGSGTPGVSIQGTGTTTPTGTSTDDSPTLGSQGDRDDADTAPAAADAPNQVVAAADSGDTLPFTGFAAIPIIIVGALLIAAGALLRRRTRAAD